MFVRRVVMLFGLVNLVNSCPDLCTCKGKKEVRCYGKGLTNQIVHQIASQIPGNVRKLFIRGGIFDRFPTEEFKINRRLGELYLDNNHLVKVPQNISSKFPNLISLDVSGNDIVEIKKDQMEGLENLRTLVLDHNKIKSIEDNAFVKLVRLRKLFISGNRIQNLTANTFTGLDVLNKLDMRENRIAFLAPGLFRHFQVPRVTLSFSSNHITRIPNGLFKPHAQIGGLDLSHNNITEIENEAFVGVTVNGAIKLINNQIGQVPLSAIRNMTSGYFIMYGNPINCSCEFYNTYVSVFTDTLQFVAACHYPPRLRGKNVASLLLNRTVSEACPICERLNVTCQNEGVCLSVNRTDFSCNCTGTYEGVYCERNRTIFEEIISPTNVTQNSLFTNQTFTTGMVLTELVKSPVLTTPISLAGDTNLTLFTNSSRFVSTGHQQNTSLGNNSTFEDYHKRYGEVVASKILWLALLCIFLIVVITKLLYVMMVENSLHDQKSKEFLLY